MKEKFLELVEFAEKISKFIQLTKDNDESVASTLKFKEWSKGILKELIYINKIKNDEDIEQLCFDIKNFETLGGSEENRFNDIHAALNVMRDNIDEYYEEDITVNNGCNLTNNKNKVFISHSHEDEKYVRQINILLKNIGIKEENVFCSSIEGQGVKNGERIESSIRKAILESKLILYVISKSFFDSIFCVEELGAGWILSSSGITTAYVMIIDDTSHNDIKGFINGDFKTTNIEDNSIDEFNDNIRELFGLPNVKSTENTKIRIPFIDAIKAIKKDEESIKEKAIKQEETIVNKKIDLNKLSHIELLMIQYILDSDKIKLLSGWQANTELASIKIWCDKNELRYDIADNYDNIIDKLSMREMIVVSSYTSYGNPKEYTITKEVMEYLDNLTNDEKNMLIDNMNNYKNLVVDDELPF